ncbi:hypothetical protein ABW21_db0201244 [Orbilia brochopaga]|nr:hypothetical protein ABW21_db0201244 [Drechslerella brochopaga]
MQAIARGVIASPSWKSSQIDQLKDDILYGVMKPRNKERLASHVQDLVAGILNTQLPAKLPSFASLTKQQGDAGAYGIPAGLEIPAAVEGLIDSAETELRQQTLLSPLVSFNPVTCPANIAQLTARLEKALLSQTEAQTRALDIRIQELTPKQESITATEPTQEADAIPTGADSISTSQQANSDKVFNPMREGLHSIATTVNQNISTARRNFAASSLSGIIGSALIVFYGIDMTLGLCIFAAVIGVSNFRFKKAAEKEWLRFCRERVRLAQQCLDRLKIYLYNRSAGEAKKAVQRYDRKAKELEQMKTALKDARKLLLQLAPDLKSRYPQWR